jgi:type IV secretion system protein TrbL
MSSRPAIVGIGTSLFSEFTQGFGGNQPTIEDALSIMLASLSLFGLGIFAPSMASGLVSGAPQLGAGAAVGTALAAGGLGVAGAMGARSAAGIAGSAMGAGTRGVGSLAGMSPTSAASPSSPTNAPPSWAQRLHRIQTMKSGASTAAHAVRSGDQGGGSNSVPLNQDDRA